MGFFATGSGPNDLRGNYGLLDQRLGISWLKENIHVFGGDPNQVCRFFSRSLSHSSFVFVKITLFGESAGGQSVSLHYLTEDMQPYFQRAIIQSAPMTIPFRYFFFEIHKDLCLLVELTVNMSHLVSFWLKRWVVE